MEERKQEITVDDVVRECVQQLRALNVPISMIDQIGVPVARVVHNLRACIDAWERDAAEKNQEPELRIEPVEGDENAD